MDVSNPTSHNTNPLFHLPQDMNAGAQILRAAIGMNLDSIDVSFTQIAARHSQGAVFGYSGYRATAGDPMLDHSLEKAFAGLASSTKESEESSREVLASLIGALPENIKELLSADPITVAASALHNSLTVTSRFLSGLEKSANAADVSEVVASRTELNKLIPFIALQGTLNIAHETSTAIRNLLSRNDPDFDYFNDALNHLEIPLKLFASIKGEIDKTDRTIRDSVRQFADRAAKELGTHLEHLKHVHPRLPHLHILHHMTEAMHTVAKSLSLPSTHSAGMYLSFHMASIGLHSHHSVAGVLGHTLAKSGDITNFLTGLAIPKSSEGVHDFFSNAVTLFNTLGMSFAALGVNPGVTPPSDSSSSGFFPLGALMMGNMGADPMSALCIGAIALALVAFQSFGNFPTAEAAELPSAHFFSFETLLNTIVGADLIDSFYQSFTSSISQDEAGAAELTPIFTLMTLTLVILAAVSYGKQNPERLFEQCGPKIQQGLVALKNLLEKSSSEDPRFSAATVAVDEALQGIDKGDYSRLTAALSTFLDFSGSSFENLTQEVGVVRNAATIVAKQMKENKMNDPTSGVITVA